MRAAVAAVAVALAALQAAPAGAGVLAALDQAAAEVAVLRPDLTAQVLVCSSPVDGGPGDGNKLAQVHASRSGAVWR